ncbi:hypothetical protein [Pseudomonas sp. GV071]|uniref:hypothetical protein n=1 Tax=Pseudomonas sp. GV071 TaxID=2135754 RepID=UPI000D347AD1|nr:hypothetical protein [Pseudomonas sp. GV071]PTQ70386.1 hypothetical protein C8K61_106108 [Pseudomonas sp. GV071]
MVTGQDADLTIERLQYFLDHSKDLGAKSLPDAEELRASVELLIAWHRLDKTEYEVVELLKLTNPQKGISYSVLYPHLSNFVSHSRELRVVEKHVAEHGYPADGCPF